MSTAELSQTLSAKNLSQKILKKFIIEDERQTNTSEILMDILEKADIFDQEDYLRRYPDVQFYVNGPIHHYITYGWREKRYFTLKREKMAGQDSLLTPSELAEENKNLFAQLTKVQAELERVYSLHPDLRQSGTTKAGK